MNILITGATGLIGSALKASLLQKNHRVLQAVRKSPPSQNRISWDPSSGKLNREALEGIDAAVHLAGESITGGRWTPEKKRRILESRVRGTKLLSESLAALSSPPKVLVSASAIGYYGDRGEELLDENCAPGTGFLPGVCREWENATEPAAAAGIRVVRLRTGIVLNARGGALGRMLPVFRLGIGGRIGGGRQYMSWITLEDIAGIIEFVLQNESLRGPVNTVSPNPVSNREFTKILGRVLSRPSVCVLPAFAARLAFGEMADALLLASARVSPSRLMEAKYPFRFPSLEAALRNTLRKT
ncbi:MAG: TIGR01777 family oxidoreductase [Acidobacteria bacterium]|nr:TIGR01777 family oxidoreductase [Acidobacteriota bacterium]